MNISQQIRQALEGSDALMGNAYVDELERLFKSSMLELIGEDEPELETHPFDSSPFKRNVLRAELRRKVEGPMRGRPISHVHPAGRIAKDQTNTGAYGVRRFCKRCKMALTYFEPGDT